MNHIKSTNRRQFLQGALAGAATGTLLGTLQSQAADQPAEQPADKKPDRKIKLGVVGLGGRGNWITGLFREHGGYTIHAVADYFPAVVNKNGAEHGVDESRRFSGLSGYKKVIESGVEAIVIIDIPYFYPEQARDALAAGLHIYMAKPVAVDVPGALSIGETGKMATRKEKVFLVDYQMPTDPINAEVLQRIHAGALGTVQAIYSNGSKGGGQSNDIPFTETIESRMQSLIWCYDIALGAGDIGNFDVHIIDAILRAVRRSPVKAYGWGDRLRKPAHGDAMDAEFVMYTFDDGVVWNHQSPYGNCDHWFSHNGGLAGEVQGSDASARLGYWDNAYVRGGEQHYGGGTVEDLYNMGARRNIATFYDSITKGECSNVTVNDGVQSLLVCILGREAARRRALLTMDEVLKENRKLEVDLTGLKA